MYYNSLLAPQTLKIVDVHPYKVSLKIKAFDTGQLYKIFVYIKKMCMICGAHKIKMAFLPIKKTHITVCRSPHIDKKSREQFIQKRHKLILSFCLSNLSALHTVLFFFKTSYLPGVEYEVSVREKAYIETKL